MSLAAVVTLAVAGFVAVDNAGVLGKTSVDVNKSAIGAASVTTGTIVDGLEEEPANLNPILSPSETFSEIVDMSLYRNLFMVNPKNQLVPQMATVVPTVKNGGISKDGLVYTIHLDPKAKWSNGQPVTSKDVQITYELIMSPEVNAVSKLGWDDVKSFQIVNDKEFKITLKEPDAAFVQDALASVMPGIIPYSVFGKMNPKDVNTAKFNSDPTVTNGPYKFVSWTPGADIEVTANPYWDGPKPKTKNIDFKIIPDQNTLLTNAKSHSINVWYFDPVQDLDQIKAISGATVHVTKMPVFEMAVVNFKDPVMKDVKVRQAMEMAIDRQAIVQQLYKGNGVLLAADQSSMAWSSNPKLKPYPYDPAQAKQLLTQDGWKMGSDGYFQKNGKDLSITYITTSGNSTREATERLIMFWFKQVGIKMTIKNYPANEYFGSILPSGKGWDLAEFQDQDSSDPPAGPQELFTPTGSADYGSYNNPTVNKLFAEQAVETNAAKRTQMMQQIETIFHDDLPALWYYAPEEIDTSINMTGYVPNPWDVDTWNCYDWALK